MQASSFRASATHSTGSRRYQSDLASTAQWRIRFDGVWLGQWRTAVHALHIGPVGPPTRCQGHLAVCDFCRIGQRAAWRTAVDKGSCQDGRQESCIWTISSPGCGQARTGADGRRCGPYWLSLGPHGELLSRDAVVGNWHPTCSRGRSAVIDAPRSCL